MTTTWVPTSTRSNRSVSQPDRRAGRLRGGRDRGRERHAEGHRGEPAHGAGAGAALRVQAEEPDKRPTPGFDYGEGGYDPNKCNVGFNEETGKFHAVDFLRRHQPGGPCMFAPATRIGSKSVGRFRDRYNPEALTASQRESTGNLRGGAQPCPIWDCPSEARHRAPEDAREGQNAPKHKTECLLGHRQPPSPLLV